GAQALTGGQLDDNVGAKVLCRQGPELVEGILRSEVKQNGYGFSARSVTQYTLEQPDQRQGMTIRHGINEVVRVDGDIAQTRAALDLTGRHPSSRMAPSASVSEEATRSARGVRDAATPPLEGPASRSSEPGMGCPGETTGPHA